MPCTFGGVNIIVPVPESSQFLADKYQPTALSSQDFIPWDGLHRSLPWLRTRPGALVWPTGASRWAEFSFYAGKAEVDAILALTNGTSTEDLVLDDGLGGTITTKMYMLAPRPVCQFPNSEPCYLCQLVDQRFFWQGRQVYDEGGDFSNTVVATATVLTDLAAALGVTFHTDSYSSSNLVLPALIDGHFKSVPRLLDLVAQSLGLRVVCDLDGTVHLLSATNGVARSNTNATDLSTQWLGGALQFSADSIDDHDETLDSFLPSHVQVIFPRVQDSVVRGEPPYLKSVAITISGQVGNGSIYDLTTLEQATFATGVTNPSNKAALDTLATTYATAWYQWQTGFLDATFSGILPATPDGLHRWEWEYNEGRITTRAIRETYEVGCWWEDLQPGGSSQTIAYLLVSTELVVPYGVATVAINGSVAVHDCHIHYYCGGTDYTVARSDEIPAAYTSPLTTKGDLFGHSTVDARVPLTGSDGYVLTEDSTTTLGVKWDQAIKTGAGAPSGTIPAGKPYYDTTNKILYISNGDGTYQQTSNAGGSGSGSISISTSSSTRAQIADFSTSLCSWNIICDTSAGGGAQLAIDLSVTSPIEGSAGPSNIASLAATNTYGTGATMNQIFLATHPPWTSFLLYAKTSVNGQLVTGRLVYTKA